MSSFPRLAAALASVLLASTLAACGEEAPSASSGALDPANPVKITVADAGYANALEIAKAKGYFSKYGLDPKLTQTQSGVATLAALQGGSLDIGYADFYAGINALGNGFDIQLVANNNTNLTSLPFLVKSGGPVKTAADLAGKKVGVSPVPQFIVNTRGFLEANGVDSNRVTFVIIQDATGAPQALERGDYDVWAGHWTAAYSNDGKTGYNFTTVGDTSTKAWSNPDATTAAFWTTGDYARKHPEIAHAFAKALYEFHAWWNAVSPSEQADLVQQYYKIDFKKIAGGDDAKLRNLLPTYYQTGPINLDATQSWYELGLKYAPDKISKGVDWKSHVFASATRSSAGGAP
ncbi:hypothetical protein GCM10010399_54750 [Dactylosporangium fulvum]|uniref:ABC transporter substrate-binding protein n=1 Tax=Dactylosporangium fulvum TaxID=53359 RepID=A0ABY5WBF0_9ACTN|nr:ABC transporter substrate-binding protein [Dactylosporangium fulvum]UWP86685.1 ABC transporter substrate-binding protein [Dactylosporangium fulvum]